MAISTKHPFVSAKTDSSDSTRVQPSNWNANHTITLEAGKVIGRDASGFGAVQELPLSFDVTLQSMVPPTGLTSQRPAAPVAGMFRFNSETFSLEFYSGTAWVVMTTAALTSLAALVTSADNIAYTTAANVYAVTSLTAFARTLLDDTTQAAMRITLGLTPGINVQAYGLDLTALEALAATGFAVRSATDTWVQRTIAPGTGVSVVNGTGVAGNPTITALCIGIGQTWQSFTGSRVVGTSYQNLTTLPIMVAISGFTNTTTAQRMQVSTDNVTWIDVGRTISASGGSSISFIVPPNHYYRSSNTSGTTTVDDWSELR